MTGELEVPEFVAAQELTVKSIMEILDEEGEQAALQVQFEDGSAIICAVWTDWSLKVERRANLEVPEYFWPPGGYSLHPLVEGAAVRGCKIGSVTAKIDEVGVLMAINLVINGHLISVRSFGGNIFISKA